MKLVDLLIKLRRDLLVIVRGVENANGYFTWDTTTPNATTRFRLYNLVQKHLLAAEKFGVYSVTRHCSCPRSEHAEYIIEKARHGVRHFNDEAFKWPGTQLYQGDRVSVCPCKLGEKPSNHYVIDELIIRKHGATKRHDRLVDALSDIQDAADNARDNKPRSAIREYLLRAIISLNEGILPQGVDEYIASRAVASA